MIWSRVATFVLKKRAFFVAIILAFTATMGYFASKVELEYNMQRLVPEDDPDVKFYDAFKKKFGDDGNKLIAAIKTPELFQLDYYLQLKKLCDSLNQIPGVKGVLSPTNVYHLELDTNDLLRMNPLVKEIPHNQAELDSLGEIFFNLKFYEGLLYNPDSKVSLIIVSVDPTYMFSEKRVELIESITEKLNAFGADQKEEMHITGLPFIRYQNATSIKNEIILFTVFAFIVTAILILVLFKNIGTLLVSLLFIAIGVLTMFGITVLCGFKLNILSGTLPPLLVVVGVQNTIYLINQYHDQYRKHGNQAKALTRIISHVGVATFLINFTTAIGFGTFYFTKTIILEQFGIVSFVTINIIFLISIVGIPILYSYLPTPSHKQTKHLDSKSWNGFLNWISHLVFKRKRRIFYWFSVVTIFATVFLIRLRPLSFIVDDIPHDSKVYRDLEYIQNNFHGAMPYEIVITSYEEGGVTNVDMLTKGRRLQRALSEFDELSKPMSIVEVISAANQAVNENDPNYYRIPKATDFGDLMMKFPSGVTSSDGNKEAGSSNKLLRGLVDSTYSQMRISYQIKDIGSVRLDSLNAVITQKAKEIFPSQEYNVAITGTSSIFLKGNKYLYNSLGQSTFWALLIISLTMTFLFPSWRMVLIAIVPNIIPLLITAGTMGYFNIPLKASTILVFSIAFGITVDATIHFVTTFRREIIVHRHSVRHALKITIPEVGISMIYSGLAVCSGFMIFAFSEFQGTQALGWLTALTIFSGIATNLFLLPALILAFEKFINPKVELKETLLDLPEGEE